MSSTDFYSSSARRHLSDPATNAEINRLARRARAGDRRAARKLANRLAGIAEVLSAKKMSIAASRGLDRDDLCQEAMRAMLEGLEGWNPQKATFRTHAFNMARWAILDAINKAHIVRVPKTFTESASKDEPTSKEFKRLNRSTQNAARMAVLPTIPLPGLPEKGAKPIDPGEAEHGYEGVLRNLALEQAFRRTRGLTDRERSVIVARFGLFGESPLTQQEVGEMLGVSNERARQIINLALQKLKDANTTPATRRMAS